jgi:hypothetical protein
MTYELHSVEKGTSPKLSDCVDSSDLKSDILQSMKEYEDEYPNHTFWIMEV